MSSNAVEYSKPQSHWWLVLIQGIAAIFLGVLLLTQPARTVATLVLFLGIYWLVSGIMTLVSLLWNREQWGLKLITGIIGILAGQFIIQNPIVSAFIAPAAYAFVLGILGIMLGIAQIIQAVRGGGWGIGVLGVMSFILGVLLVTNPLIGAASLVWMLAILLIVGGIAALFASLRLRGEQKAYEEAQAQAARAATAAGSTVKSAGNRTAGVVGAGAAGAVGAAAAGTAAVSRAGAGLERTATGAAGTVGAGAANVAESATSAVTGVAATGAAAVSRAGDGLERTASGAVNAATGAAGTVGTGAANVAESAAKGVAGVAATGTAAVSRAGDGLEGAASGAADTVGEFAAGAGTVVKDTAGDIAGGVAGLAAAGAGAAQDAGGAVVEAVEAVFTGNVNPLDTEEMAKYKYPLEFIEGVGQASADKLRAVGINNCLELLKRGYTAKGRAEIAAQSGISGKSILTWVNHVDLYRIKGVGSEYADLLEASGVDTVVELAQRNAANLFTRMNDLNAEKKLVRRTPTQSQVQDWVAQAKSLPRIITY